jgi:tetratricopeptide (TPR) repeat protein
MAKRIILISSFPICIAFVVIALVLAGVGRGQSAVSTAIPPAIAPEPFASERTNILSLTDSGKLAEADAAVNKLTSDCKDAAVLTANYYIIADSFAWRRMNDRAGRLYQLVIDKSPDSSLVNKARLGLARIKILGLIDAQKYPEAQEKLDSMIKDFNDVAELDSALFQLGMEFKWRHRFTEAQTAFDNVSSSSNLSNKTKLLAAMSNICEMITSGPVDASNDKEIAAAIDKFLNDFAGNPGLAEEVYWISREYEWKKGRVEIEERKGWYDTPNSVYERLIQQFGNSSYGWDAQWDQKRLSHRTKIFKLIQEPNQAATDAAIEAMVTDFKGRPELSGELRWIAWGYEEQNKGSQAKKIFKRIIEQCPGTVDANEAVVDLRRLDIWDTIKAGDSNRADILINNFVNDFNQHPYASSAINGIALNCNMTALELNSKSKTEEAKLYFERAVNIWKRAIEKMPNSSATPNAWFFSGICYRSLGRNDDAVKCFKEVSEKWPGSSSEAGCLENIGICYEELLKQGQIDQNQANTEIEKAYKKLAEQYPDRPQTANTIINLGWLYFRQGKLDEAISWFEKGLSKYSECCKPADALYVVGRYYQKTGQKEKAAMAYKALLKSLPESDPQVEKVKQNLSQINDRTNQ